MASQKKPAGTFDGIVNQNALFVFGAFPLVYASFVPVTSYITKPGGIVDHAVHGVIRYLVPNGANVTAKGAIPALAGIYIFATFAFTGAWSVAGQASSRKEGLDNNHPRAHVNNLHGLPLRLRSSHLNLMENFPGFALAAALAAALNPKDPQIINLLGLHVLLKLFVFYPAYLLNIAPPRSFSHLLATSSMINVCLRLATS